MGPLPGGSCPGRESSEQEEEVRLWAGARPTGLTIVDEDEDEPTADLPAEVQALHRAAGWVPREERDPEGGACVALEGFADTSCCEGSQQQDAGVLHPVCGGAEDASTGTDGSELPVAPPSTGGEPSPSSEAPPVGAGVSEAPGAGPGVGGGAEDPAALPSDGSAEGSAPLTSSDRADDAGDAVGREAQPSTRALAQGAIRLAAPAPSSPPTPAARPHLAEGQVHVSDDVRLTPLGVALLHQSAATLRPNKRGRSGGRRGAHE